MWRSVSRKCQLIVMTLMACFALAACGTDSEPQAPTVVPVTSTPQATPMTTVAGVGEIVWTGEVSPDTQAPVGTLTALPNDAPLVIAALPVETIPAGTVLQAHWMIDGRALPALDPEPVTTERGLSGAWVTWTLHWVGEEPWPIGRLGISVEIDGREGTASEIPIVRPNP